MQTWISPERYEENGSTTSTHDDDGGQVDVSPTSSPPSVIGGSTVLSLCRGHERHQGEDAGESDECGSFE